jgi:hypothetical protein
LCHVRLTWPTTRPSWAQPNGLCRAWHDGPEAILSCFGPTHLARPKWTGIVGQLSEKYQNQGCTFLPSLCVWPYVSLLPRRLLGFDSRGLAHSSRSVTKTVNSRSRHVVSGMEISTNLFLCPELGSRAGLFIVRDQWSYYNTINTPNYLLRQ